MKEPTKIRHKTKENANCTETLCKEFWGSEDIRLTCHKCGFAKIVHIDVFSKWQYCDEVI